MHPIQQAELEAMIALLRADGVTRYLEIGARHGESFDFVMRGLPAGASGTAVDLPEGPWGKKGSRRALPECIRQLNADGYACRAIFGDCRADAVVADVTRGGPYDAVFIDADHRYEAVSADWSIYRAFARLVAFHDIADVGAIDKHHGYPVEVPRLWDRLKTSHRTREFIEPNSIFGVGVVYV